jgi:hypothetical protein
MRKKEEEKRTHWETTIHIMYRQCGSFAAMGGGAGWSWSLEVLVVVIGGKWREGGGRMVEGGEEGVGVVE